MFVLFLFCCCFFFPFILMVVFNFCWIFSPLLCQRVLFSYMIIKLNFSHEITLSQSILKQHKPASYLPISYSASPLFYLGGIFQLLARWHHKLLLNNSLPGESQMLGVRTVDRTGFKNWNCFSKSRTIGSYVNPACQILSQSSQCLHTIRIR